MDQFKVKEIYRLDYICNENMKYNNGKKNVEIIILINAKSFLKIENNWW